MAFVTHEIAVGAGSYAPSHEYCMAWRVRMNDGRMTHVDELRACKQAKKKLDWSWRAQIDLESALPCGKYRGPWKTVPDKGPGPEYVLVVRADREHLWGELVFRHHKNVAESHTSKSFSNGREP